MALPLIGAIGAGVSAVKAFKIGTWIKVLGAVLIVIALVFLVKQTVKLVKDAELDHYNRAFEAGSTATQKAWEAAKAREYKRQRDAVTANVERSNKAIMDYLEELQSREPKIIRVKERTTVYAQTPAGQTQCLDVDGVGLLNEYRDAIGYRDPSTTRTTGTISGTLPVAPGIGD